MKSMPGGRKSVRIANVDPAKQATGNAMHSKSIGGSGIYGSSSSLGDSAMLGEDTVSLLSKISLLDKDLERRQASYSSREDAYKTRIEQLEEELSSQSLQQPGWAKMGPNLGKLKAIQSEILNSVELVQDRTARIMQEQERDLLRSFRARLFDVQTELEKEKSKKDDGLAAWRERHAQLTAELSWATEVANRLDKVNNTLSQENKQLKAKNVSQNEDRNFFVKKLVAVKKENALLRSQITELSKELSNLDSQFAHQAEQLATQGSSPPMKGPNAAAQLQQQKIESEERFKDTNVRLRRLLAEEQRSLQQMRQTYALELKTRTEMELLLRKCVEDVRRAIVEQHHAAAEFSHSTAGTDLAKLYSSQPGLLPLDEFEREERQRMLELLLSQERVVSLIYAKTFPIVSAASIANSKHQNAFNAAGSSGGTASNISSKGGNATLRQLSGMGAGTGDIMRSNSDVHVASGNAGNDSGQQVVSSTSPPQQQQSNTGDSTLPALR